MAADWARIQSEYINGNCSFRDIVRKYGVSMGQIAKRSKAGNWVLKREQRRNKVVAKTVEKTTDKEAEAACLLQDTALYLMQRMAETIKGMTSEELDCRYRDYANSLKNLKDVLGKPLDDRKTLAQIDAIRAEIEGDKAAPEVTVIMGGNAERWSK